MVESNKEKSSFNWEGASKKGEIDAEIRQRIDEIEDDIFKILSTHIIVAKEASIIQEEISKFKPRALLLIDEYPQLKENDIDNKIKGNLENLNKKIELHLIRKAYCEITFDSYPIYKFFEALGSFVDQSFICIGEDAITLSPMDPSRIGLMEIYINNNSYRHFMNDQILINIGDLT